jgi:hypothetical protein
MILERVVRELQPWVRSRGEDDLGVVLFLDAGVVPALHDLLEQQELVLDPVNRYGAYLRSDTTASDGDNGGTVELSLEPPRTEVNTAVANAWLLLCRIAGPESDSLVDVPPFGSQELHLLTAQLLYSGGFGSPVQPLGPLAYTMAALLDDRASEATTTTDQVSLTIAELHQIYLTASRLSR